MDICCICDNQTIKKIIHADLLIIVDYLKYNKNLNYFMCYSTCFVGFKIERRMYQGGFSSVEQ